MGEAAIRLRLRTNWARRGVNRRWPSVIGRAFCWWLHNARRAKRGQDDSNGLGTLAARNCIDASSRPANSGIVRSQLHPSEFGARRNLNILRNVGPSKTMFCRKAIRTASLVGTVDDEHRLGTVVECPRKLFWSVMRTGLCRGAPRKQLG